MRKLGILEESEKMMNDIHRAMFNLSASFGDFSKALGPTIGKMEELKESLEEIERLKKRKRSLLIRLVILWTIFILCISYIIWQNM